MQYIRLFRDPAAPVPGNAPLHTILGGMDDNDFGVTEGLEVDGITLKPGYERVALTGEVRKIEGYTPPNNGLFPKADPPAGDPPPAKTYVSEDEAVEKNGVLKPGYIREQGTDKIYKDPEYKPQVLPEGVNPDGTIKDGYQRNQDGTVTKTGAPAPKKEEGDDEPVEGEDFYAAVEAVSGVKYDIEYPPGIEPTTPEGVAHREKVIRETAMLDFEEYLKENKPRAYAYLLHTDRGGSDEDFFKGPATFSLPTLDALKASADVQSSVYKYDLMSKGLSEAKASALVDVSAKAGTLATDAEESWKTIDAAKQAQLQQVAAATAADKLKYDTSIANLASMLQKTIRDEISFLVPEARQQEFRQYITNNLRYDDGKFWFVQPLEGENMKTLVESLFFQFNKGDLNTLITKKMKTEAAHKLKLTTKRTSQGGGGSQEPPKIDSGNLPLSAILPT